MNTLVKKKQPNLTFVTFKERETADVSPVFKIKKRPLNWHVFSKILFIINSVEHSAKVK